MRNRSKSLGTVSYRRANNFAGVSFRQNMHHKRLDVNSFGMRLDFRRIRGGNFYSYSFFFFITFLFYLTHTCSRWYSIGFDCNSCRNKIYYSIIIPQYILLLRMCCLYYLPNNTIVSLCSMKTSSPRLTKNMFIAELRI